MKTYVVECIREVRLEIDATSHEEAERKAETLLDLPDARIPDWQVTAWEAGEKNRGNKPLAR